MKNEKWVADYANDNWYRLDDGAEPDDGCEAFDSELMAASAISSSLDSQYHDIRRKLTATTQRIVELRLADGLVDNRNRKFQVDIREEITEERTLRVAAPTPKEAARKASLMWVDCGMVGPNDVYIWVNEREFNVGDESFSEAEIEDDESS